MKVIQVFEHERLRIGDERNNVTFSEAHFHTISKLNEKHSNKFFTILHKGIRFSSYVGVIQISGLTIEILPKADNVPDRYSQVWRRVLIDMLVQSHFMNFTILGEAGLHLRRGSILDIYIGAFLEKVERLCQRGLVKKYRPVTGKINYWKGRPQFAKHLRQHLIHQEKLYAVHQVYDHQHYLNQILWEALRIIPKLTTQPPLITQSLRLIGQFPEFKKGVESKKVWNPIQFDRHTNRYCHAINYALLLISNFTPDLQYGTHHSFMLLVNMDALFEAFIYHQIKKVVTKYELKVSKQVSKTIWAESKIRPDILVYHKPSGKKYVIDTKWKKLKTYQPAAEDLRQMFVYNHYFNASKGLLLYPAIYLKASKTEAFEKTEKLSHEKNYYENYCAVGFIDVLDGKGKLNDKIGSEIIEMLITNELA